MNWTVWLTRLCNLDPNLIICLGNCSLWALAGRTGITKLRGTTLLATHTAADFKLLPTYHPSAILRQWDNRPTVIADLMKAKRESAIPKSGDLPVKSGSNLASTISATLYPNTLLDADYFPSILRQVDRELLASVLLPAEKSRLSFLSMTPETRLEVIGRLERMKLNAGILFDLFSAIEASRSFSKMEPTISPSSSEPTGSKP